MASSDPLSDGLAGGTAVGSHDGTTNWRMSSRDDRWRGRCERRMGVITLSVPSSVVYSRTRWEAWVQTLRL